MSRVRLIAGKFGGRFIQAPPTSATHPMSERARSAIFNIIGSSVESASVLDAFAGSGSLGLESLGRGADSVLFLDSNRVASRVIAENVKSLGVEDQAKVVNASVASWVSTSNEGGFDIIFADPPYHREQFSTVEKLLGLLKVGGCMILSHSGRGGVLNKTGIVVVDNRSYGNAYITLYRRIE